MKSSLNSAKKSLSRASKKTAIFLLVFVMLFSFLITPLNTAKAQMLVSDTLSTAWSIKGTIWQKLTNTLKVLLLKGGAMAFQQVVRTALNKIAYDTANYLGSGGKGQKPLFITQNWGDYLAQIGDEAAGQFVESFAANLSQPIDPECQKAYQECVKPCVAPAGTNPLAPTAPSNAFCDEEGQPSCASVTPGSSCLQACKDAVTNCSNRTSSFGATTGGTGGSSSDNAASDMNQPSFNVCQPSSLEAKVKIGLGLVEQQRPGAPNCTASAMIQNWGDEAQKLTDFKDPEFLNKFKDIFNPTSNDLGIYMSARADMVNKQVKVDEKSKLNLTANKGWQSKTNIAKKAIGVPEDAKTKSEIAQKSQAEQMARTTGDILIDAANVFLNQFATSAFNNLMSQLGKKASEGSIDTPGGGPDVTKPTNDPNILYGEGNLREVTSSIIKPDFGVLADYDILSQLVICPDKKNPGPTNCVIDDKLMQGIAEKKTVAEAIKDGYIHGDWQLSKDTVENTYSLRNISILRKYRILPIGWEEAINRAFANANSIKKVTVSDLVSCFDPTDSYNQFSSDFNTRDQAWCRGLIDPNWVLKAPLNYCRKQGAGAQIMNKMVIPSIPGISGNPYTPSALSVTRAEDYCADDQTCIKEKDDGSCEVYGYCNEEKRTWNFTADTCQPIYNTCQNFTNPITGKSVSYLENTLNYTGCNPESAGCRQYSTFGAYATSTRVISWEANESTFFNKNITSCNNKDEGCTELLRVKPTWGSNLVMDANFINETIGASSTAGTNLNDWPYWSSSNAISSSRRAVIVDAGQEPGGAIGKALMLSATRNDSGQIVIGTYSDPTNSLVPENLQLIPGQSYTVSVDVYLAEGHMAHLYLGKVEDGFVKSTSVLGNWQHLSITRLANGAFSEQLFGVNADNINGNNVKVYIKNLKFEVSDFETSFNLYGAYKVYEKILPPYLEKACYNDISSATKDYRLRADAPAECFSFARKCNREEVGCELFTDTKNGLSVPAQVTSADYCPGECLGYDTYISKEDHFNSPQAENLIPKTAKACGLEAAGCNEFTNLDELNQGGENKEYYTFLKQCIKPSQTQCASFYSWEGTDSGYQLRAYSLKKDAGGNPAVTADDSALCTAAIYSKPLGDPQYNPDCREFYNSAGQISYHLISRTITCSDNCHAYRMSDKNIDKTLTQAECSANPTTSHWDANLNACYVCLNGGTWDNQISSCVYQAIPGEGNTCNASDNGCREYNGNDGNNVKMLSYYDFESGAQGWTSNCTGGVQITTISNNKNGHSLLYKDVAAGCSNIGMEVELQNNLSAKAPLIKQVLASANVAAQVKVGGQVTQGKAYNLRFIAKAASDTSLQVYFFNNEVTNPQKAYFATSTLVVKGGGDWNIYSTNLENLDHAIGANEMLVITADHDFYFDNIILTEITDRYYLIKNTSVIPDICYYDMFDNYQGADYNLGCAQYTDRNNLKHNLHKFSKLCSDSAVGCEQVIATQNYAPYKNGIWGDTNKNGVCDASEPDCLTVPGDRAMYAVFDPAKQCNSADLGCSRLGLGTLGATVWTDVYKKNNPNLYDKVLCGQDEVGCEEWKASDGTLNHFRDPGNDTCQYRASQDPTIAGKAWYKVPVKRCDANSNGQIEGAEKTSKVCNTTTDCSGKPCIIDTNDYPCSTSYFKTFGLGGAGNQVSIPDQQAGLCEANSSGCTEYIDPVSRFSPNLVYNPGYEGLAGGWGSPSGEKWKGVNLSNDEQVITIDPNKLYVFSTKNNTGNAPTSLDFLTGVKGLLADNTLGTTTTNISIPTGANQNIIFASLNNSKARVKGGEVKKYIEVKGLVINYQLQENIDRKSCNGIVNFDNGCVLFNERTVNGGNGLVDLSDKWDAASSTDKLAPVNCDSSIPGSCTANQLIKVRPNRICAKWLDCLTYVQDPTTKTRTCYAVGECTRLDDKNECANFEDVNANPPTIKFDNTGSNKNATGYYLLDKYHLSNMNEVGLNTEAHYDFEDSVPSLSCERADANNQSACAFNKNIVTDLLVREPDKAPTDYPAHGATYLKVPSSYLVSPQSKSNYVKLIAGETYYLNFLVNTKGSGLGARIIIKNKVNDPNANVVKEVVFAANNGWERKVVEFEVPVAATANEKSFKIMLGASDPNKEGNVYFDDINIEPVLEISGDTQAAKQYVTRECRLYPTNDSLTCVNKNDNVLKDGWEGYCLAHDSNNSDVCLMWYPVDAISAAKTTRNVLGYQGKFPLSYCTEVNGNFDLVEKRVPKLVAISQCGTNNWYGNQTLMNVWSGATTKEDELGSYFATHGTASVNPNLIKNFCGPTAIGNYWLQIQVFNSEGSTWFSSYTCMPAYMDLKGKLVKQGEDLTVRVSQCWEGDGIKLGTWEGWFKYNGLDTNNSSTMFIDGDGNGNNLISYKYYFDEAKNADPAVRVYNYDFEPADEDGLKLLSSKEAEKVFSLTCNRFAQVVDNNGDNKAWVARTGINSIFATATPAFFIDNAGGNKFFGTTTGAYIDHQISAYGRNREDVPFGSAVWPDSFSLLNSEPIKFRNQYSKKNNEEVSAGRPYGCFNGGKGSGCSNIGYCSLDPSVFCLVTDNYDVNRKSCADGGYGVCVPIWAKSLETNISTQKYDFKEILKTLFLRTYNSYYFDGNSYTSDQKGEYDWVDNILNTKPQCSPRPVNTYSSPNTDSFCSIAPYVASSSVIMKFGSQVTTGGNPFNINKKGIYSLEFTTFVDPEQQPLKEIYIDWGDGSKQVITGQDSHSDASNPHIFYHYYKSVGSKPVMINIKDNWGAFGQYGECASNVCLPPVYAD